MTARRRQPRHDQGARGREAVGGEVAEPGTGGDFNDLLVAEGAAAVAARFAIEREPTSEVQGDFRVQADGIYHKKDRITSRVDVLGICRDGENKGWGRYLAVHDPDGGVHHVVMPSAATVGDSGECIRILVDLGMAPPIGRAGRELVIKYICTWETDARARSVSQIGWHGGHSSCPIEPSALRPKRWPCKPPAQSNSRSPARSTGGGRTLPPWRSATAVSPSRWPPASLGRCCTWSTPSRAGSISGGHPPSAKHLLCTPRASVWGCTSGSWRTTDNASEAAAAGACDTLMLLDEVSQAKASAVDAMAYMLANGCRQGRADRTGAARDVAIWRILLLSTGETGLADKIAEDGKQARAGQSVRVVDIPADVGQGLGVFENLHGFADGALLSAH